MAESMFLPAAVAFVLGAILTPWLARWARSRNLLDVPNYRSSHVVATPRTGGAAFIVAVVAGLCVDRLFNNAVSSEVWVVVVCACVIGLLGLIDDLRPLPPSFRLLVQTGVSAFAVWRLGHELVPGIVPSTIGAAITIVWIVALTNAYNFMDGIDGIAGAQAVIAGLGWFAIGSLVRWPEVAALGLLVSIATATFLIHNWEPARVFMGDAGAGFLGFLFAAIPLIRVQRPQGVLWWAVLLTWPFLFDTGLTLIRRFRNGENIFSAHRSHLYQRLITTGLSHAQVTLLYSGLAITGAVGAIALAAGPTASWFLSALVVAIAAFALWRYVGWREMRGRDLLVPPR